MTPGTENSASESVDLHEGSGRSPHPVLRITCTDLATGESETTEIPAGEYVLLTTAPCHVASTQTYPAKGTHIVTIKGRTAP